ncbi:MAG: CHC2 zinc finger domain-containing protein [Candidatus Methanoperedens sp.]|nr:CHC2 zinc finger domain-containing protein [Candidatus Methanoperedens sp.]
MREFAYKPLPHESPLNLVRIHRIGSLDKLAGLVRAYSNRPGFYVSVYAFEPENRPGKLDYDTAIIDRLYLDFDSKEDLSMALYETCMTKDVLQDLSIEAHSYFSGQKGTANYIDFSPTAIAVENKKEVLGLFWDIVHEGLYSGSRRLILSTLDGGSVRGDIARVSRLPNTPHKSGYFCVPLNARDVRKGANHIRQLAKQPRYDFDLDIIIKDNIRINDRVVPGLLKNLEDVVVERRKEEGEERESRAVQMRRAPAAEKNGRFVSKEEIQMAKSYPISRILGNKKLVFCPLHKDDVPSLSINHQKNLWRCFGCGRSGNVIQLVMEMEGICFMAAVRKLLNYVMYECKVYT